MPPEKSGNEQKPHMCRCAPERLIRALVAMRCWPKRILMLCSFIIILQHVFSVFANVETLMCCNKNNFSALHRCSLLCALAGELFVELNDL